MGLFAGASGLARHGLGSYAGIQTAAVISSLVLTIFVVAQDQMPNNDGVLYLYSAELISAGDWARALQLFNWPFYSLLIAAIHKTSGLGVEMSAYLLNAVLHALTVYAFIGVVAAAGGRREVLLSAALLLLIYPAFNDYRAAIIRDFGYWSFATLALLCLLKSRGGQFKIYVLGWTLSLMLAALFRIEGLVLLAVFPLLLLLDTGDVLRVRVYRVLGVYGALLLTAGLMLLIVGISGADIVSLRQWNKPFQMVTDFYAAISSDLASRAQILKDHYLIRYSHDYAWSIVLIGILVILLTEVVSSIGFVYLILAGYALVSSKSTMTAYARSVVMSLGILNLAMLGAFVAMLGFLAGRYPIGLALLVMVLAAFGVLPLYESLSSWAKTRARSRWVSAVFVLTAVYFLIDGAVTTSPGKVHVAQAAGWLRDHVDSSERVFATDYPLLFRSGKIEFQAYAALRAANREGGNLRLRKERSFSARLAETDWKGYDFVVALISRKDPDEQKNIEALLSAAPLKEFRDRRGDRVLIYRLASDSGAGEGG